MFRLLALPRIHYFHKSQIAGYILQSISSPLNFTLFKRFNQRLNIFYLITFTMDYFSAYFYNGEVKVSLIKSWKSL